jgi:hypothetical protein
LQPSKPSFCCLHGQEGSAVGVILKKVDGFVVQLAPSVMPYAASVFMHSIISILDSNFGSCSPNFDLMLSDIPRTLSSMLLVFFLIGLVTTNSLPERLLVLPTPEETMWLDKDGVGSSLELLGVLS